MDKISWLLIGVLIISVIFVSGCTGEKTLPPLTTNNIELIGADWNNQGCAMTKANCPSYLAPDSGGNLCGRFIVNITMPAGINYETMPPGINPEVSCYLFVDGKKGGLYYIDQGHHELGVDVPLSESQEHTMQLCCIGNWEKKSTDSASACQTTILEKFC